MNKVKKIVASEKINRGQLVERVNGKVRPFKRNRPTSKGKEKVGKRYIYKGGPTGK